MNPNLVPEYWKSFVMQHPLVGTDVEFPWPGEEELTAVIEILDGDGIEHEARDAYPGIGVLQDGFVPVGTCSIGTGDPYFINVNDGPAGPLYKINHASADADGYDRESSVSTMLETYHDVLKFRNT